MDSPPSSTRVNNDKETRRMRVESDCRAAKQEGSLGRLPPFSRVGALQQQQLGKKST